METHSSDDTGEGFDWAARGAELETEGEIGLGWAEPAMAWLAGLPGTRPVESALDLGAGPGVFTGALARTFPAARVTAVDAESVLLDRALARARRTGTADRVEVLRADLGEGMARLPGADLIWVSRVVHHLPDQDAALRDLADRLHPGGLLALVEGGLPTRFLPQECGVGEPGLLSRLDAAAERTLAAMLGRGRAEGAARPEYDWGIRMAQAGLSSAVSRSFLLELRAPVAPDVRGWAAGRIARAHAWAERTLDAADLAAVDRLLDPDDPLGVHQRPDLFVLTAVTVHAARRPARPG